MRVVLLGPPGAGKGTQAEKIAHHYKVPKLSTGDILRKAAKGDDVFSKQVRSVMESGGLISDDMMIGIVRQALTDTGAAGGFILDGFPRTSEQARQLNAILRDIGVALDAVLHIEAPTEELIRRITGRFSCKSCGKGYHKEFLLPKRDGVCDDCGGTQFSSRSDDNVHTLRARLKAYEEQTAPLVAFYRASDVPLYDIDGMAPIDRVTDAIFASLDRTA